jgi:ligand-binding SRPBCC domain-containing protein
MATYHLRREATLDCPLEELFSFFADARNLETMTPSWLHFRILSPLPVEMKVGALIRYRLRLHGIPISWTTRITVWDPPWRFVDEQLSGPYRMWVHEHTFEATATGTLARDHVRYRVYGGALVNRFLVRRDLERVFDYRQARLASVSAELTGAQRQSGFTTGT